MEHPLNHAEFRFYEELNDFLAPDRRRQSFDYAFPGSPAIKDPIEALGVPHTEVDLILVDGESVPFDHHLHGGERVAVYPVFEAFDLTPVYRLRPKPLREPRFVLDVHLGRLAAYLRLLGFDTAYRNDYEDIEIAGIALREHRIVLTRDIGLLKHNAVSHGAFLRETAPMRQVREVLDRFQLDGLLHPFARCALCNGEVELVDKAAIRDEVPEKVYALCEDFSRCRSCRRLFWAGGHYDRMKQQFSAIGVALP